MDGQVTWLDLGISSGKMCPEHFRATKGGTSRQSSKRSSASQSRKPPILKCLKKAGQLGGATTMRWEDDGAWLGECMTRNTGESPNAAVVSRLSQILEVTPQEKYSLSAKACQGILRRAERRGKDLPEMLKTVLLMQSESGGGCDGGGKGALVQEDKSGTLGTGNDQTIFCLATQQGGAELRSDDRAPTLTAAAGMSGNNQPVVCAGFEATPINLMVATRGKALGRGTGFGVGQPGDPANTISAAHSHGVFATAIPINDKATRWQGGGESRNHNGSGNGLGIGKEGDPSPTLTAGDRHGVAYISGVDGYNGDLTGDVASTIGVNCGMSTGRNGVMELSANENGGMARDSVLCAGFKAGQGAQAGGIGYSEEVSPTLASAPSGTNQTPAVVALDMSHACDVIRDCGEIVPSLQARMGTGGNQVPLTYQQTTGTLSPGAHAGSYNGQDAYNDMLVVSSEISPTLRAKGNDPYREDMAAYIASVDCRNFREGGETNGTLQAKSNGGTSYNLQNTVRTGMIVRRLTPMECERLQGFPDGWTDIGEWRDSKGKLRKPSDSPRYKALGNSIALPFWDFLAKRISAQYLRPVTMGSLFDGIGGFPLVFERHNGKGTARWASEIEEFPIAVTKLRFGED